MGLWGTLGWIWTSSDAYWSRCLTVAAPQAPKPDPCPGARLGWDATWISLQGSLRRGLGLFDNPWSLTFGLVLMCWRHLTRMVTGDSTFVRHNPIRVRVRVRVRWQRETGGTTWIRTPPHQPFLTPPPAGQVFLGLTLLLSGQGEDRLRAAFMMMDADASGEVTEPEAPHMPSRTTSPNPKAALAPYIAAGRGFPPHRCPAGRW